MGFKMLHFTKENPIKLMIVDDHEIFRVGVSKLLSIDKTIQVVAEASNGLEAISEAEIHKPDVIFLDIFMPKMDGITALPRLREVSPDSLIIMLTAFEDFGHIEMALSAGADGYLTKGISAQILQEAITKVLDGERVFSKSIVKLLSDRKIYFDGSDESNIGITKKEELVLKLIAEGLANKEISDRLNLSIRTVESHRYNLLKKLNLKTASQLVRFAVINSKYIEID